jgi:transcriptional adapter 2-alpha
LLEDENDVDVKARAKWIEEHGQTPNPAIGSTSAGANGTPMPNGVKSPTLNGRHVNGDSTLGKRKSRSKSEDEAEPMSAVTDDRDEEQEIDETVQPPPFETKESLQFKLTLQEIYHQKLQKRAEGKAIIHDRGLVEHRKVRRFTCTFISEIRR